LAEVEALAVADDQVPLDDAIGRRRQRDPRAGAPRAGGLSEAVADDHVVVGVEAVGDLVEDPRVVVVGDQAVAHHATLVADVEPEAGAAIVDEPGPLDDDVPAEPQLVSAGLPAPAEALDVVVAHDALAEPQAVRAGGAEAELPVVPEDAASDDQA